MHLNDACGVCDSSSVSYSGDSCACASDDHVGCSREDRAQSAAGDVG